MDKNYTYQPQLGVCALVGCELDAKTRGLCKYHYNRCKAGKLPIPDGVNMVINPFCKADDCNQRMQTVKSGLCHSHSVRTGEKSTRLRGYGPREGICSHSSCCEKILSAGFCSWHYDQYRRGFEMTDKPDSGKLICAFDLCNSVSFKRVYCTFHREQLSAGATLTPAPKRVIQRKSTKRPKVEPTECALDGCERMSVHYKRSLCKSHVVAANRYGMDDATFLAARSNAVCEACGTSERRLVMDHDHSCCNQPSGKSCGRCFRGVLCSNCNSALGLLGDDAGRVNLLLSYINKF